MSITMTGATPRRVRRAQTLSLALLIVSGVVNYMDRGTLSVANSTIRAELGVSLGQMGLLLSAFSWSYALSQLPAGALVDRIGPRKLLTAGLGDLVAGSGGGRSGDELRAVHRLPHRAGRGRGAAGLVVAVIWVYLTWLPGYLTLERHMSLVRTGFAASIPFFCGFIGCLVAGWFTDQMTRDNANLVLDALSDLFLVRHPVGAAG